MIKNIIFDIDDTILDFKASERMALSKTLIHFNIEPKPQILDRYSVINEGEWKKLEKGKLTIEELKPSRFKILFDEIGITSLSPIEATTYYESSLADFAIYCDGAKELLEKLHKTHKIYLASNGTLAVQKKRIKALKLYNLTDGAFISEEIGFDKPDVRFFEVCFSKIQNFKQSETILVGDSLTSDIQGAKNSGIKSIWYNPRHKINNTRVQADFEIFRLDELPRVLDIINEGDYYEKN